MKIYHVYANPIDTYGYYPVSFGYYSSKRLAEKRIAELKRNRLKRMIEKGYEPSDSISHIKDNYYHPICKEYTINEDENDHADLDFYT